MTKVSGTSSPAVTVTAWTPEHDATVDRFVSAHPEGLIYYGPAFRRFLLAVAGGECRSMLAFEAGRLTGVMPLLMRTDRFGAVVNSLPFFGSHGGVLATTAAAERALRAEYDRLAAAEAVAATWIAHPFLDVTPPAHTMTDERIAQWTALTPADPPAWRTAVEPAALRNLRKAQSEGVTVCESAEAIGAIEQIHLENMAALGGRAKPHAFFERLSDTMAFGRDWRLYVAERDGEPLAALLTFEAARTVEYVMPAVKASARALEPTAALLAEAMTGAAARGFTRWNWGGTWLTQDGVYRFKKKWGAQERRYQYFVTVNDPSLHRRSAADLAAAYPWYYVVPYRSLEPAIAKGSP